MRRIPLEIIICGVLSGILYTVTGSGLLVGILTGFVPLIPIFWCGFRFGSTAALISTLIGIGLMAILFNPSPALLMLLLQGIPALIIIHSTLSFAVTPGQGVGYLPMGRVMVRVIVYEILFFMVLTWIAQSRGTPLQELFVKDVKAANGLFDPQIQLQMETMARSAPFILFGLIGWFWSLMLYGTAWMAHFVTETYRPVLRHSLRIDAFALPPLYPIGIAVLWGAGVTMSGTAQFIVWTAATFLMLGYLLYGIALLHALIGRWKNPQGWHFGFYAMLLFFPWMTVIIAFYGLLHHGMLILGRNRRI